MTINKSPLEEPKWGKTQPTKSPAAQTMGCKAQRAQKPCKSHDKITDDYHMKHISSSEFENFTKQ
jgi:hypothetical protein